MAKKRKMNVLDWIALVLLVIGGINWGIIGVAGLNLVTMLLGGVPLLERLVYVLVGLSGLYTIYTFTKIVRW